MTFFGRVPITHRLTLIVTLTTGAALLVAFLSVIAYEGVEARRDLVRDATALAAIIAGNVSGPLSLDQPVAVERILNSAAGTPDIDGAVVYDNAGAVFSFYRNMASPEGQQFLPPPVLLAGDRFGDNSLQIGFGITRAGVRIGTLLLQTDLDAARARVSGSASVAAVMLVVATTLAYLMAAALLAPVSSPITHLAKVVGAVTTTRDYSIRAETESNDELGRLIDGFNEMLGQIQARDSALEQARGGLEQRIVERTRDLQLEIAERKDAEAAMRRSEEQLSSVFENASIGMALVAPDGRWLKVNRALCDLVGYSPEELAALSFQDITHPDDLPADNEFVRQMLAGEIQTYQMEKRYCHKLKHVIWAQLSVSLVRDAQGQPLHFIAQIQDITERKKSDQALAESEARLRALVEHSSDMIVIVSLDGRVTYLSPSFQAISGYAPAEMMGTGFLQLLHPDDVKAALEQFRDLARHPGQVRRAERRYRHKDGSWMVSDNIAVNLAHVPGVGGIVTTMRDVTERKRSQQALADSGTRLRALIEHSSDIIAITSTDGRLLYVSPSIKTIAGYEPAELAGRSFLELVHPDDQAKTLAQFKELSGQPGLVQRIERRYRTKSGAWMESDSIAVNLTHVPGVAGIVTTMRDVTERKRTEAELALTHEQLLDASRRGGMAEVAIGVLHNVGNALNGVTVSASLMVENIKTSRVDDMASVVSLLREHRADLASYITSDPRGQHIPAVLAEISQDWHGRQQTLITELEALRSGVDHIKDIVAMHQTYVSSAGVAELVNVRDLVEDCLRVKEGILMREHIDVTRAYQDVPAIMVEKHKVLQVLMTLLNNARLACDERTVTGGRIALGIARAGDRVSVSVNDNGVGIAPENLARVFAQGFTTRKDGHGQRLHRGALTATELGGSLTARSAGLGKGATFLLELPLQPPATPA